MGFTVYLLRKTFKENNLLNMSDKSLVDKVVIVTGSNSGIGYEVALDCASRGAHVILACRNEQRATQARSQIISSTGNEKVEFFHLDLSSFSSIRKFIEKLKEHHYSIYCLVNNAGLFWVPYMETKDGFESNFGVNHLGNFLLTILLIPILSKEHSRIVFVGSLSYMIAKINFEDINYRKRGYDFIGAYADSKLANLMTAQILAKKLKIESNIQTYCADPGVVATKIGRDSAFMGSFLYANILKPMIEFLIFKSPKEGAVPVIYCVCSDQVQHESGQFYTSGGHEEPWVAGKDVIANEKLWNVSLEMTGLNLDEFKSYFNIE